MKLIPWYVVVKFYEYLSCTVTHQSIFVYVTMTQLFEAKLKRNGYVPIQQRIGDLQRAKMEELDRIRQEVANENKDVMTFQPKVNKRTKKIVQRLRRDDEVFDSRMGSQQSFASVAHPAAVNNCGERLNKYAEQQVRSFTTELRFLQIVH